MPWGECSSTRQRPLEGSSQQEQNFGSLRTAAEAVQLLLLEGKERRGVALQQGAAGRGLVLVLAWEAVVVPPSGGPGLLSFLSPHSPESNLRCQTPPASLSRCPMQEGLGCLLVPSSSHLRSSTGGSWPASRTGTMARSAAALKYIKRVPGRYGGGCYLRRRLC